MRPTKYYFTSSAHFYIFLTLALLVVKNSTSGCLILCGRSHLFQFSVCGSSSCDVYSCKEEGIHKHVCAHPGTVVCSVIMQKHLCCRLQSAEWPPMFPRTEQGPVGECVQSVPQNMLANQLQVVKWMRNWLDGCMQSVIVSGSMSKWKPVLQGSILGPMVLRHLRKQWDLAHPWQNCRWHRPELTGRATRGKAGEVGPYKHHEGLSARSCT